MIRPIARGLPGREEEQQQRGRGGRQRKRNEK
jgi:hypothetical protein